MGNIKIFRANRGEGKTKWLAERIRECTNAGHKLYYVGNKTSFESVKRLYEATYYEKCPLDYGDTYVTVDYCFFTDDLMENAINLVNFQQFIVENRCDWYITMGKEDFVN